MNNTVENDSVQDSLSSLNSKVDLMMDVLQSLGKGHFAPSDAKEIRDKLNLLVEREQKKDFYSTSEVALILKKSEFTVREWCRLGRINARKQSSGRGSHRAWVIAHEELLRIQREGLQPLTNTSSGN